jgi:hypothetical protein
MKLITTFVHVKKVNYNSGRGTRTNKLRVMGKKLKVPFGGAWLIKKCSEWSSKKYSYASNNYQSTDGLLI